MLPIGLNEKENKVLQLNIRRPRNINVMSKSNEDRAKYVNKIIINSTKYYSPKDITYMVIDLAKELDISNQLYKPFNVLDICQIQTQVLSTLEVIQEEIDKRNKLLQEMVCKNFDDLEATVRQTKSDYKNPPTIYLVIQHVEITRIKLKDDGSSYVKYFDELLKYIMKFGSKCGVGIIISSYNTNTKNYPLEILPYITHRIAVNCNNTDFQSYFNFIGNIQLDNQAIYFQEQFSPLEILKYSFVEAEKKSTYKK